ncbi:hypothetical protein CYMTET_23856 [Cymbomonas tetramitiformis]|uniref:C2 domain-containing protein n=1 Tax=Cymbomonas tetramitiformis TaxID=36881 RepID=A0AAE0FXV8_9CHLO|nr:hypothetical protein CYMTET_23856 [Cymbomonas tetramitiformis]
MPPGSLHVNVLQAHRLRDSQTFGTQDPYCVVKVGRAVNKTKTHTDGGTNPVWNERFVYSLQTEEEVEISIWNKNQLMTDDSLGTVRIPLMKVFTDGHDDVEAPVICPKGTARGVVKIILQFTPTASPASVQPGDGRRPSMNYPAPTPTLGPAPSMNFPAPTPTLGPAPP